MLIRSKNNGMIFKRNMMNVLINESMTQKSIIKSAKKNMELYTINQNS